jgi:1-acyl-sn-glycerol-3-phosphate acyltransferase
MAYYNKPFSLDLIAGFIRAVIRMTLVMISIFLTFMIFIPLNHVLPRSRRAGNRERFQRFLMGLILKILGCRIIRSGPKPRGQIFFVSNHLGAIDVFTVMAETGARMVAKESLSRIPVFGYFMEQFGIIFIKRDSLQDMNRVVQEMTKAYKEGDPVAFFPEGTTSRGEGIRVLLGALFLPAVECGAPVYYGTMRFHVPSKRWPIASVSACQVGGAKFIYHVFKLCYLPRVEIHITYGDTPVEPAKRKALVREVEQRMVKQFVPMEQLPKEVLDSISQQVARESLALKSRPFILADKMLED